MDPNGSSCAAGNAQSSASSSLPSSGRAMPRTTYMPAGEAQRQLNHRVSSISDLSDFDTFDVYQSAAVLQQDPGAAGSSQFDPQASLRGRPSLVSLNSLVFDESIGAYTKVATDGTATSTPQTATPPATSTAGAAASTLASSLQYVDRPPATHTASESGWPAPSSSSSVPASYFAYDSSYGSSSGTPSPSGSYSPSGGLTRRLSNMFSARRQNSRLSQLTHGTIMEEDSNDASHESIDMTSLVRNAAPIGQSPTAFKPYSLLAGRDLENTDDGARARDRRRGLNSGADIPVDLTSFFGPASGQDTEFIKSLQEQEASGKLTMGLGAGFEPGTRLKESDLLASASASGSAVASPITPVSIFGADSGSSLRRTLSRRWPLASASASNASTPLTPSAVPASPASLYRQGTVRALAQSEANRRGEVVELIMEEDEEDDCALQNGSGRVRNNASGDLGSKVDLSVISAAEAPDPLGPGGMSKVSRQQSTIPLRGTASDVTQKTRVFYPQPNWRPFSMRWPYLTGLVVLSVVLGAGQELIYRMSLRRPLVEFQSPSEIPGELYFAVKFAPTLVAVTYGVLWQVTDFEVKRLEAFYQMSKANGAVADESINVDYVTHFTFFRPFRALYCKHYAVAVSSVATLLAVSLVPTLGAATIVLTPSRAERLAHPAGMKTMIVSAVWSRFLSATLFFIALLGCVLFWLLQRRRSGLLSDVKGIAGLASMAVVSHIMTDFQGMDLYTHKKIHSKLKDHRYVLRNSSLAPDDENPVSLAERERYKEFGSHMSENPHPLMLRARGCVPYIASILLFAGLIPVVLFTPANVITDRASWLLTALAVAIKLGWGGLETSVRMMEPYYLLWRRHAPAKTLMLDYTAVPFLLVAVQALQNGHYLVFFLGFGTIMTEILTVLVTSLATVEGRYFVDNAGANTNGAESGEETVVSFWVTLALVSFILSYMSIVATVVFIRRRRPFLPRQPNTIASVLVYIHQSKMLWNFVGTSKMNNAEMLAKLEAMGNTYGLGWFLGRDGKKHCGVDQEELMSSYKLGYDYTMSNNPWEEQPEV